MTKEIKFKSKSWIDAFGSKFAKASGGVFNWATTQLSASLVLPFHAFFFAGIVGAGLRLPIYWVVVMIVR